MAHPTIEAWLKAAPGRAMNPDRRYGLQCVDAVDQYAQDIFGVPWQQCVGGVAGAKQLLDVAPDAYWIRINNDGSPDLIPRRGDVVVWSGDQYNQWGHTAVVLSATRDGASFLQQDGFAVPHQWVDGAWYSAKPAHVAWLRYAQAGTGHVLGWLRPRAEKLPRIQHQSETINKRKEWDEMASKAEVQAAAKAALLDLLNDKEIDLQGNFDWKGRTSIATTLGWQAHNFNNQYVLTEQVRADVAKLHGALNGLARVVAEGQNLTEEQLQNMLNEAAQNAFGQYELELRKIGAEQ